MTALYLAISFNDINTVNLLLSNARIDPNIFASHKIKKIINDVESPVSYYEESPLHLCAKRLYKPYILSLLELPVTNLEIKDSDGKKPEDFLNIFESCKDLLDLFSQKKNKKY